MDAMVGFVVEIPGKKVRDKPIEVLGALDRHHV